MTLMTNPPWSVRAALASADCAPTRSNTLQYVASTSLRRRHVGRRASTVSVTLVEYSLSTDLNQDAQSTKTRHVKFTCTLGSFVL